jgi:hypothetical protein
MKNDNLKLISLKDASKATPYSADYLSLLVRKGRLEGYKREGKWYTTENAVMSYLQKTAESSYEHQQNLNVKVPAEEIKKAKINFRWAAVLLAVVLFSVILIWKIMDDKNMENVRNKYRISEDKEGNLTIFAPDPALIKSVNVMQK